MEDRMVREARDVVMEDQWVMETDDHLIKVNRVTSVKAEVIHMLKPTSHNPTLTSLTLTLTSTSTKLPTSNNLNQ